MKRLSPCAINHRLQAAVGENLPKGIASAMISAIFGQQPATDPQKNYLRFLAVAFDEDILKYEAM